MSDPLLPSNLLVESLSPQAREAWAEFGAAVETETSSEAPDAAKGARVDAALDRMDALPEPDRGIINMLIQME
jgi:hypothetical protein